MATPTTSHPEFRFLETMYRGRDYYILSGDSSLLEVECAVTRSREVFRLRWDEKKESMRQIQIQKILQMRSFKDGQHKFGVNFRHRF